MFFVKKSSAYGLQYEIFCFTLLDRLEAVINAVWVAVGRPFGFGHDAFQYIADFRSKISESAKEIDGRIKEGEVKDTAFAHDQPAMEQSGQDIHNDLDIPPAICARIHREMLKQPIDDIKDWHKGVHLTHRVSLIYDL
jgi:hypothetical protein